MVFKTKLAGWGARGHRLLFPVAGVTLLLFFFTKFTQAITIVPVTGWMESWLARSALLSSQVGRPPPTPMYSLGWKRNSVEEEEEEECILKMPALV